MRRWLKKTIETAKSLPTTIRMDDGGVLSASAVAHFNLVNTDEPRVEVVDTLGGFHEITGNLAIDAVMAYRPSLFEGKRMKWHRRAWLVHNLVGHPLMQVLALLGQKQMALKVHDATIPRPRLRSGN